MLKVAISGLSGTALLIFGWVAPLKWPNLLPDQIDQLMWLGAALLALAAILAGWVVAKGTVTCQQHWWRWTYSQRRSLGRQWERQQRAGRRARCDWLAGPITERRWGLLREPNVRLCRYLGLSGRRDALRPQGTD